MFLLGIFTILHFHQFPTGLKIDQVARSEAYPMSRRVCSGLLPFIQGHWNYGYLKNNGTLETAQKIAARESPRTMKLYDRVDDRLTLDEIEKISV